MRFFEFTVMILLCKSYEIDRVKRYDMIAFVISSVAEPLITVRSTS